MSPVNSFIAITQSMAKDSAKENRMFQLIENKYFVNLLKYFSLIVFNNLNQL